MRKTTVLIDHFIRESARNLFLPQSKSSSMANQLHTIFTIYGYASKSNGGKTLAIFPDTDLDLIVRVVDVLATSNFEVRRKFIFLHTGSSNCSC